MTETESAEVRSWRLEAVWSGLATYSQRPWLRCLLLILFGAGVHIPALQGQLIWDDVYLARDNPLIKSPLLILETFRHYLFPESYSGHYRPFQNISYIFDYLIWNTESYGYHLSNVLWHVGSGVLLYFLLKELFRSLGSRRLAKIGGDLSHPVSARLSTTAFFFALLWMVHPVHSAAVDYISGRADSLTFFFACAGWLLYLQARKLPRRWLRVGYYALAALSGLLMLCSRESGCMWMLVFLLYTLCFERKLILKEKLVVLAACLAITAIYAGLRQLPESRPEPVVPTTYSPATRAVLMLRALGDYGRLLVFPSNLHMERSVSDPVSLASHDGWRGSIRLEYLSLAGAGVLAVMAFGAFRKGAGQNARVFGASWFLLTYLPISNLFELNATVAEHWLYLPSVGFFIFLAGVAFELPARFRRGAVAYACLAVVALSARSAIRSSDWIDPETFYQRTFLAGGSSCRVGVNLAMLYSKRGEHGKAEAILRKVLRVYPDYPVARNNLADVLFRQGKTKEAEAMFDSASRTASEDRHEYPRTWTAALNFAHLRHREKDDQTALAVMEKARVDYPGTWDLISFEAEVLRVSRGPAAALPLVQDFERAHWWHSGASIALGRLHSEMGDVAKAEAAFRHASWLDVYDAEALNLMALLSVRQNKLEDACKTQRRAVARQPDQPRQYLLLSDILSKMGRAEEARVTLAQASAMKGEPPPPVN
ncbi:MAG: protein O-mannosyl-transferase [Verrucomicrobiota bacterium]|jgi:tetratricopeptide (TPR) repeat protein